MKRAAILLLTLAVSGVGVGSSAKQDTAPLTAGQVALLANTAASADHDRARIRQAMSDPDPQSRSLVSTVSR